MINERLIGLLDAINILSHYQIEFRRGYRTVDHVFVLDTILNSYFSKGTKVYVCFVDFSKVYDSVWKNGLLYKLNLNGLSLKFILLIKSMYTELQVAVKLPNGVTPYFSSLVGVRQGRNLSPIFSTYLSTIFLTFLRMQSVIQLRYIPNRYTVLYMQMICSS